MLARLEAEGLEPSPPAGRVAFARRLSLDLLGLPPSWEEARDFGLNDSPDSDERLVDRMLASPRHGERWARHWLDVIRFAETNGFEMNQPRDNAWRFRDYIIRAFNEDRPYDQLIVEQLAGDGLGADVATSYLVAGPWDQVKSPDPQLTQEQRQNELHDMVSATGSTFLGLTVGCARCHNHKFDPISMKDYYGLQAVFSGVQHGEREIDETGDGAARAAELARAEAALGHIEERLLELEPLARPEVAAGGQAASRVAVDPRGNVERFAPVEVRLVRFTVLATNGGEPCLDELEVFTPGPERRNLALATLGTRARASSVFAGSDLHKLEHLNDGRHGNSRSWISAEPGAGWVELELPAAAVIDSVVWARDREGVFKDRLPVEYRVEVAPSREAPWRLVAGSSDRARPGTEPPLQPKAASLREERRRLAEDVARLRSRPRAYAGMFTPPPETHILRRGDPLLPGEVVGPGAIEVLGPPLGVSVDSPERGRRLALARWITGPARELAARVMVNRLWLHHFGEGLVSTPGDFGANGERPSHPELLDWLACELIESGWSLKHLHREIVLSSTYRQTSAPRPEALARDAQSRLLWRYPPRRLDAEALHDTILATAGVLDLAMGGPGYSAFNPNENYVRVYEPKTSFGPGDYRRMVYQKKVRMQQDGTFGAFDCPDGGQVCSKRARSTTPLQSIGLLNSPFTLEVAAACVRGLSSFEPSQQVTELFRRSLARDPSAEELAMVVDLVRSHGLRAFARVLFNSNELLFLP